MPQNLYCWRCRMVIPMLDEEEFSAVLAHAVLPDREYATDEEVTAESRAGKLRALAAYKQLTGFDETIFNALVHHRIAQYGPPCHACGKPLRTSKAAFCAACGADRK